MMNDPEFLRETERFFQEQIPITRSMGIQVESYDSERLVLTAPLENNHNHLGTAFGGSLSAIATLAGYGLLWLELGDRSAHIVIRDSSIRYFHPVREGIRAICLRPEQSEIVTFKTRFNQTGKARLPVEVVIEEGGRTCVSFQGTYVAIR
jgi:thioesterase domain-containing protein